jgi:hypothetical protein
MKNSTNQYKKDSKKNFDIQSSNFITRQDFEYFKLHNHKEGNSQELKLYENLSFFFKPTTSAPIAKEGMVYANATDHHLYYFNGTAWKQLDNA